MNELLDNVIGAHGGLDRWKALKSLTVTAVSSGGLFALKAMPQDPVPRDQTVSLHEEFASVFPFGQADWRTHFTPHRVAIETTAGVLLIVAAASLFGWVLTTTRVTEYATEALLSVTDNRYIILLLANLLLLFVGCFLEPIASISILVPVLMPVILKVGIDPVHFGVVMTLNLMIGLLRKASR